ncbi:prostate androgen-regulated mucin-like protein 1 [Sceloporus undulatus]|uniref:prostate androgen-regulated mucin-like protein 1 n=1 Tax=Sceloporus undulatus TaxID=8520 RepID=UPI001C4C72E4|nr:prostate androgen-regulated mucin-like protein 1 [Sceloporus undulatus]
MAGQSSPALSALSLLFLTAGLTVCCASSASVPASSTASPSNIFTSGTVEPDHVTTTPSNSILASTRLPATPLTSLSFGTTLRDSAQATSAGTTATDAKIEVSSTTPLLRTSDMSISTAPQTITGLQSTENINTSVTPVASTTMENFTHSQTLAFTSSQSLHESSTIIAPSDITKLSTVDATQSPSTETSVPVVTSKKAHTIEVTSGKTHVTSTSSGPLESLTSTEALTSKKISPEPLPAEGTTFSAGITIEEVQRALSPGDIAAITITVMQWCVGFRHCCILKIRHTSYGRLFDDHDYGSWGNYNNPLYDDS